MGFSRRSVLGFSCIVLGFSPQGWDAAESGMRGEGWRAYRAFIAESLTKHLLFGAVLGMSKAPNRWNCNGSGLVMVPPQGFEP